MGMEGLQHAYCFRDVFMRHLAVVPSFVFNWLLATSSLIIAFLVEVNQEEVEIR